MERVRLGRTNVEVPIISLGTWGHGGPNVAGGNSVGWSGHDDAKAREALVRAWELGITHWDTADVYGNGHAEQLIGEVFGRVPRGDVFLASKVGYDRGPHELAYDPAWMRRQLERSLRNLKTDVIDLHYFHHCDFGPDDARLEPALAEMRRFRDEGKIRFIGLSDWSDARIMRVIDRVDPDVVQPYRNLTHDSFAESGLKDWAEAHDAGLCFFSPLRHGLLLGKYERPTTFPEGDFRRTDAAFGDAQVIARLRDNAQRLRERFADDPEPVLRPIVAALLDDAPTACVLLGQRNAQQVESAARAGRRLTNDEAAFVRSLFADLREAPEAG